MSTKSPVAKYYQRNLKEFPSRYPYTQPTEHHIPNISLHSTPSSSNQISIACSLLTSNSSLLTPNSTAILLADESLMPSLIHRNIKFTRLHQFLHRSKFGFICHLTAIISAHVTVENAHFVGIHLGTRVTCGANDTAPIGV